VKEDFTMAKRGPDPAKERMWREVLRRWRQSDLTIRAFCAREGLSEPSFYQWRRELARRDRAAAKTARPGNHAAASVPRFVPVEVVAQTTTTIEIVVPTGAVVRVRPGCDRQTLETLGQVLALLTAAVPEGRTGGALC
jgi:hypothetical protein